MRFSDDVKVRPRELSVVTRVIDTQLSRIPLGRVRIARTFAFHLWGSEFLSCSFLVICGGQIEVRAGFLGALAFSTALNFTPPLSTLSPLPYSLIRFRDGASDLVKRH